MKETIKKYWYDLAEQYSIEYDEPIFTSYENSIPFVENFKSYLENKLKENPDVRTKMTVAEIEKEFLTRKLKR